MWAKLIAELINVTLIRAIWPTILDDILDPILYLSLSLSIAPLYVVNVVRLHSNWYRYGNQKGTLIDPL